MFLPSHLRVRFTKPFKEGGRKFFSFSTLRLCVCVAYLFKNVSVQITGQTILESYRIWNNDVFVQEIRFEIFNRCARIISM